MKWEGGSSETRERPREGECIRSDEFLAREPRIRDDRVRERRRERRANNEL